MVLRKKASLDVALAVLFSADAAHELQAKCRSLRTTHETLGRGCCQMKNANMAALEENTTAQGSHASTRPEGRDCCGLMNMKAERFDTNMREERMRVAKILITALLTASAPSFAHEKHAGGAVKVVGEVIDTVCYVSHESRGLDHLECARECAAKGISLGILQEKTGRVYLSLPIDHSSPNEKLLEFIARRVEVRGAIFRKGGLTGIFVHSVRELPASMPSRGLKR